MISHMLLSSWMILVYTSYVAVNDADAYSTDGRPTRHLFEAGGQQAKRSVEKKTMQRGGGVVLVFDSRRFAAQLSNTCNYHREHLISVTKRVLPVGKLMHIGKKVYAVLTFAVFK
jgi:hypothetical protein